MNLFLLFGLYGFDRRSVCMRIAMWKKKKPTEAKDISCFGGRDIN